MENTKANKGVSTFANWDLDPAFLLIAVGFLIFLLGFCGCVGALRENIVLLKFVSICKLVWSENYALNSCMLII